MGCGCAQRREWLRRKFSHWANPLANFSIANEAPSKSTEGAWVKSTEGARAVTATNLADLRLFHNTSTTFIKQWSVQWHEFGDQVSELQGTILDHTMRVYESGALKVSVVMDLVTDVSLGSTDPFQICTGPDTVPNPDGITIANPDTLSGPETDITDTSNVTFIYSRDSDGAVIRKFDNLVLCATESFPTFNTWWFKPA